MKRKVCFLLSIIAAVSLLACTNLSFSTDDKSRPEVVASTDSTEESRSTEDLSETEKLQSSPSELVKEPSEADSSVIETTEQSTTPEQTNQTAELSYSSTSQDTVSINPETSEKNSESLTTTPANSESEVVTLAPPAVSELDPTPSAPPVIPDPQPIVPSFDVGRYVSYATSYGTGIGLVLDSTATGCWDTPIEAHSDCVYLERDIQDCLEWYKASGYTAFWVWSVNVGGGNYEIYIGYA